MSRRSANHRSKTHHREPIRRDHQQNPRRRKAPATPKGPRENLPDLRTRLEAIQDQFFQPPRKDCKNTLRILRQEQDAQRHQNRTRPIPQSHRLREFLYFTEIRAHLLREGRTRQEEKRSLGSTTQNPPQVPQKRMENCRILLAR